MLDPLGAVLSSAKAASASLATLNSLGSSMSCFHPTDALESLHAAILRVETIARVASEAVDHLHCPLDPAARRAFARMQILVGKAAEEASAALARGDQVMAALANHPPA